MIDAVTPDANLGTARVAPGGASTSAPPTSRARIASLDIVRGAVMVLMAIDHVRVYSGLPPGGPTPGIFFTRWITHFVAPAFVFLAGTGAWLYGRKVGDRGVLARFLVTRGLWLVLLELTVVRVAWTFNVDFAHYMLAGVLWMIGWCMIIMAGLIALPLPVVGAFGVALILGHNIMDYVTPNGPPSTLMMFLYSGGQVQLGPNGPGLDVLFVIIPWIGVMAAGYAFGPVMRMTPERRRRICLALGGGAIVAFIGLRALDGYGDPRPWSHPSAAQLRAQKQQQQQPQDARPSQSPPPAQAQPPRPPMVIRFLNTSKYPASLLFLLMTLGPMLVAIPLLELARGKVADVLTTFGRVPFFYYLLHIPAIHVAAIVVSLIRTGSVTPWLFGNHPMEPPPLPDGYVWSLPLLYLVWAIVVTALYFPCRWYAEKKARDTSGWLSYL
jgi:uncharacterized membrane protein